MSRRWTEEEDNFIKENYLTMTDEEIAQHLVDRHKGGVKNEFCKKNNIPLLIIPYWDKDNIYNILDDFLYDITN